MSCYKFYEIDGRSGEFNDDLARDYDRYYIARCNSFMDSEPEIWAHPKCPIPYQTLADWDRLSRCKSVTCTHIPKSRWDFKVHAKFSSIQFQQPRDDNPLKDPAEIDSDTELVSEERYVDRQGRPMCNTAGDLIRMVVDIPRLTIRVQKNVALKNSWLSKTAGIVNSAAIRIDGDLYDAGTLRVLRARVGKVEYRNEKPYKVAQLEIRHKEEGWQQIALNQGYNEIVEDWEKEDSKGQPLKTKVRARMGFYTTSGNSGDPEPNPVFLDKDGFRPREEYRDKNGILYGKTVTITTVNSNGKKKTKTLHGGVAKTVLEPSDIVLLKFDVLKLFDFNRLPLN